MFKPGKPILESIKRSGLEFDQRMEQALRYAEGLEGDGISDGGIFSALHSLNSINSRFLDPNIEWKNTTSRPRGVEAARIVAEPNLAGPILAKILTASVDLAVAESSKTLGVAHFTRAALELSFEEGDKYEQRPVLVDLLAKSYSGSHHTALSELPKVRELLRALEQAPDGADDFQYLISMRGNRIVFRAASPLGDYIQQSQSGIFLPRRALITHFKQQFGAIAEDDIAELEHLLNSETAAEKDYQSFFERNPHFLRQWDHREVYPHVALARPNEGPLVPDFILTDRDLHKAAILELKLPNPKLIRRQKNRERFASCVVEARSQLLRYRDWFRESNNRRSIAHRVGMEIYEPHLIVVIGRSSDFHDSVDRMRLRADNPDIEVVTYDDILTLANRRRVAISKHSN